MKKITLIFATIFLAVWVSNAQTLPAEITKNLNANHAGWTKASGYCEGKKWFLTGDFDGNGRKDYLVRIKKGKSAKSMRLVLIAYFSSANGNYQPEKILDDKYSDDLLRSSFSVIKKGAKIQLGEGEGPIITLKNDAASQYVCETDAVKTLIYEKGKWRNIYDQ